MILIGLQNQIDAKNKYQDFNQANLIEMDSNTKMRIDEKKEEKKEGLIEYAIETHLKSTNE